MNRPVKHILLIHANLLNSFVLGDIIEMYQKNGYKIIKLEDALTDPYYAKYMQQPKLINQAQSSEKTKVID